MISKSCDNLAGNHSKVRKSQLKALSEVGKDVVNNQKARAAYLEWLIVD